MARCYETLARARNVGATDYGSTGNLQAHRPKGSLSSHPFGGMFRAVPALLVITFAIAAFGGLLWWLINHAKRDAERIDRVWLEAADRLHGKLTPRETGFFASKPRRIDVDIDGRHVSVDHYAVSSGDSTTYYTRIQTHCDPPHDLKLRVSKVNGFSGLARAIGFQDVPVGDPRFDEDYIIKASDPELAPMWINKQVREAVVAAHKGYRYKLERGKVTVERAGIEDDVASIVSACHAAATFANGKKRLLDAWGKLARHFGGEARSVPEGWVHVEGEHEGVPFAIEVKDVRDYHFTVIEARITGATSKVEPFALSKEGHLFGSTMPHVEPPPFDAAGYTLYSLNAHRLAGFVTDDDMQAMKAIDAAKVRVDESKVTIMLYGVVTKKKPLHDAIGLATSLASGARHGPYR